MPAPPKGGFVVEVGGGNNAHPASDVQFEKYPADDFERGGQVTLSTPLIVADGHHLPLADGCADYVIASHVLEHATDPVGFGAELGRIADAGYIQLPSRLAELTFGWPFHPWLVDLDADGTLVFHPRDGQVAPCGEYFHERYATSGLTRLWWTSRMSDWHHTVHWQGAPRVRVAEAGATAAQTATFDLAETTAFLRATVAEPQVLSPAIRAALRCPSDGGALHDAGDALVCQTCVSSYPVVSGVPLLTAEAASGGQAHRALRAA